MARRYPKLAGTARPIRSSEDKYGFTSMETYARGELETYPQELLSLYAEYVNKLQEAGLSLSQKNLNTMVAMYGYKNISLAQFSCFSTNFRPNFSTLSRSYLSSFIESVIQEGSPEITPGISFI